MKKNIFNFNALMKEEVQAETLKVLKQTGRTNIKEDKRRVAKLPGKRISKTGRIYWETRKNRSDRVPSKKL